MRTRQNSCKKAKKGYAVEPSHWEGTSKAVKSWVKENVGTKEMTLFCGGKWDGLEQEKTQRRVLSESSLVLPKAVLDGEAKAQERRAAEEEVEARGKNTLDIQASTQFLNKPLPHLVDSLSNPL